ncbi:hypothetical protein BAE44_0011996 [Dichanthelium oligosanthes]|uniref:Uncharacterized protein n=1 Tax=Dichanthelium oligosanthes TaxID=888268 RepID=A0A1E5VPB5_9POAL|nr:hypothetical protein BAE44_0011996 [Dichanthelium oligosanthes]
MQFIQAQLHLQRKAGLGPRAMPMKSAGPVPPAMAPQQLYRGEKAKFSGVLHSSQPKNDISTIRMDLAR